MPRFRLTVRWMMVVVAVMAMILGLLVERRARFWIVSLAHKRERVAFPVSDLDMYLLTTDRPLGQDRSPSYVAAELEAHAESVRAARPLSEFIAYHQAMADKYKRASIRPWMPISPDPPRPPRPSKEYVEAILAPIQDPPTSHQE